VARPPRLSESGQASVDIKSFIISISCRNYETFNMGGRYGKYGEIKRFERLRKNRRNLSCGQGRPGFVKGHAGKVRPLKKHLRHPGTKN